MTHFAGYDTFTTPLESPTIYGGDGRYKGLVFYRKGGVEAPFFLRGFTFVKMAPESRIEFVAKTVTDLRKVCGTGELLF